MTKHNDRIYLGHMLDMAHEARFYVQDVSRESFDADRVLQRALVNLLQGIGEAARKISPDGQQRMDDVPWSRIIGMRHKLVHDYVDIDYDTIWRTIHEELPALIVILEAYIEEDP